MTNHLRLPLSGHVADTVSVTMLRAGWRYVGHAKECRVKAG